MSFRRKGTRNTGHPRSLPAFSVDTEADAKALLVLHGSLAYDGRYLFTGFGGELDDLNAAAEKMAASYRRMKKRRTSQRQRR